MKASYRKSYGKAEDIQLMERPVPKPEKDEILVKVHASSVNRTDEGVLLGKPYIFRFFVGWPKPKKSSLGTDFSGTIESVGSEVSSFSKGDEVYGFYDEGLGSHAEYVTVSIKKAVLLKPSSISHEQAVAALEGAHYAYFFLKNMPLKPGMSIFVNGATGAIGNAMVQLLRARGIQVSFSYPGYALPHIENLSYLERIDYVKEDFTERPTTYDVVLDAVGKSSFRKCKKVLKPGGIYISSELGKHGENIPLSILGFFQRKKRHVRFPMPGSILESMQAIKPLLEKGQFEPLIDTIYPFQEIKKAYSHMLSHQKLGAVLLKM